jgi:hypothetical protein
MDEANIRRSVGPAKLVFVHGLLAQLLQSIVHCHKLVVKQTLLTEALSRTRPGVVRRWTTQSENHPMQALRIEEQLDILHKKLAEGLNSFDVARATTKWLIRDYKLVRGMVTLQERKRALGERPPSQDVEAACYEVQADVERQTLAIQANDRDSILIGFNFLDTNNSGFIEPSDLPSLAADAFNALDLHRHHKISPDDLKRAVSMAITAYEDHARRLETIEQKIQSHRAQKSGEQVEQNQQMLESEEAEIGRLNLKVNQVSKDMQSSRVLFDAVDQFFFEAFTRHVWNRLQETKETEEQFCALVEAIRIERQAPLEPI